MNGRIQRVATGVLASLLLAFVFAPAMTAIPAAAEVTDGPCRGRVEFSSKTSDPVLSAEHPRSHVFTVPKRDTARFSATLGDGAQPFDEPIRFEGGVDLRLLRWTRPLAKWSGESTQVSVEGEHAYTIPRFVPTGVGVLEVTAWHRQGDVSCASVVDVRLNDRPGPAALFAVAGTVVFGAGTLAAGVKKRVRA